MPRRILRTGIRTQSRRPERRRAMSRCHRVASRCTSCPCYRTISGSSLCLARSATDRRGPQAGFYRDDGDSGQALERQGKILAARLQGKSSCSRSCTENELHHEISQSLVVIDYLLHSGSPAVISYFRSNIYIIKTLTEFQYVDDTGRDVGGNIRARARDITRLLNDETRLASERRNRQQMHDRMLGRSSHETSGERPESREARRGDGADDEDLQRALEASQRNEQGMTNEERDLARALQLSREEEEERKRKEMEKSTQDALFDDNQQMCVSIVSGLISAALTWYLETLWTHLSLQHLTFSPNSLSCSHSTLSSSLNILNTRYSRSSLNFNHSTQCNLSTQRTIPTLNNNSTMS